MIDSARLLAAYDSQLRREAETPGAVSVATTTPYNWMRTDVDGSR